MTQLKKMASVCSVLVAAGLVGSASAAETASATISATALGGGNFQYNIALKNTSSTPIGTFWFSWIPGYDFMNVIPTSITAPTGWINPVTGPDFTSDGYAIEYYNNGGSGDQLAAGATDNFSFDSTETLSQISGAGMGPLGSIYDQTTAFVYAGFPETDAGFEFNATPVVPEPVSAGILATSAGALLLRRRNRAK
jgi:hypothetical protein